METPAAQRSMMQHQLIRVGAGLILGMVLLVFLTTSLRINAWSLGVLHDRVADGQRESTTAPADHARAEFWQAQEVLQEGDPQRAMLMVSEAAQQGEPLSGLIMGMAAGAQQDWKTAAVWLYDPITLNMLKTQIDAATSPEEVDRLIDLYLQAQPYHASMTTQLVDFLHQNGRDEDSAEVLRLAVETNPQIKERIGWALQAASLYGELEKWPEAVAVLEMVVNDGNSNWQVHMRLGQALARTGETGLALTSFLRAAEVNEEISSPLFDAAQELVAQGAVDEADQLFDIATSRQPERRNWYSVWIDALRSAGRYERALIVSESAAEVFSDDHDILVELALTYALAGKLPEAGEAMARALNSLDSPRVRELVEAASFFEEYGFKEQALATYQQVLDLAPRNRVARRAVERLTSE